MRGSTIQKYTSSGFIFNLSQYFYAHAHTTHSTIFSAKRQWKFAEIQWTNRLKTLIYFWKLAFNFEWLFVYLPPPPPLRGCCMSLWTHLDNFTSEFWSYRMIDLIFLLRCSALRFFSLSLSSKHVNRMVFGLACKKINLSAERENCVRKTDFCRWN